MPCIYDDFGESERRQRAELDKATRILCEALGLLDTMGEIQHLSDEAQAWWARHQEADRLRAQRERMAHQQSEERRQAARKLTPRERALLGVKDTP